MNDLPVWLLNVDGVINVTQPGWGAPPRRVHVFSASSGDAYPIRYAPGLLTRIRKIHAAGLAEVRWCTTWCADAAELEARLGLPRFGRAFTEPVNGRAAALAKLTAALGVLADDRPLIWTDDTETPTSGDLHDRLTFDGRALLLAPKARFGLRPDDLSAIEGFCRRFGKVRARPDTGASR